MISPFFYGFIKDSRVKSEIIMLVIYGFMILIISSYHLLTITRCAVFFVQDVYGVFAISI